MYEVEVSIIIPCYNAEKTIINTLESIRSQTYQNFEIIIINDGSKDASEKEIRRYILEHPSIRIKYFCQENKGVSAARNKGMQKAAGKYISFIDADDLYHPQFLQILYGTFVNNSIDIVCCQYKTIDNKSAFRKKSYHVKGAEIISKEALLDIYIHKRKNLISFFSAIYKREIIEKNKIEFPVDIKFGEDTEFICKYFVHCDNGGIFLEKELYGYFIHSQSAMRGKCDWRRTDNLKATRNIINYWKQNVENIHFADYMFSRALWACAKDFIAENESLFKRLQKEYDLKHAMKVMMRYGDEVSVRVSAMTFLFNERLYRLLIVWYTKGQRHHFKEQ